MKWLCPIIFFHFIIIETSSTQNIELEPIMTTYPYTVDVNITERLKDTKIIGPYKEVRQKSSYSVWSKWSECQGNYKTRRRHCIRRRICGDTLRVEVKSSRRYVNWIRMMYRRDSEVFRSGQLGAPVHGGVPQRCIKRGICGRQIVKQSAYCYMEGSYCQLWIRSRMHKRQDPGETIVDVLPPPAPVIHPEDTRAASTITSCGKVGRYRGNPEARMRSRMRDMLRIIGGRPAPPGKWPWQVAVLNRYKEAFCGGTLVTLRWVVTAAHCVRRRLYVRLGEHDLLLRNYGEVEMKVTEAVIHPRYDPDTVVNDVAMLRLPYPARPDLGHGVACLPNPYQTLPPHTSCVILGWGKKRPTDVHGTRVLHEAQVLTIQQGVCRRSYWQYAITDNMVCAGRGRRDSCAGDSGGPLLCRDSSMRYFLQGITSFGDGCGKRGKYGIYTRTAGYVTWMKDIMNSKYFD